MLLLCMCSFRLGYLRLDPARHNKGQPGPTAEMLHQKDDAQEKVSVKEINSEHVCDRTLSLRVSSPPKIC